MLRGLATVTFFADDLAASNRGRWPFVRQVVIDCPYPRMLAEFYRELLGYDYRPGDEPPPPGEPDPLGGDWLVIRPKAGDATSGRGIAFQHADDFVPPAWTASDEQAGPGYQRQMLHLDMTVPGRESLAWQRDRAVELGATIRLDRSGDDEEPLYVFADPAGHDKQPIVARRKSLGYCYVQPNVAESGNNMEYGSIEREIHVDASPEVVFEVVSSPEHIREWWSDEADFDPVPGATGELAWGDETTPRAQVVPLTVVDAEPPRLFSFRWVYSAGEVATPTNSLLVTFELVPSGAGTVIRLTETGFREMGWEVAVLEEQYKEHCVGWDTFLPRLGEYVTRLVSTP